MTRIRIGVFLLLFLLILGIIVQAGMGNIHRPVARILELSAADANAGNWDSASALAGKADMLWQKYWHFSAALADHQPMEDIDALFARLETAGEQRDSMEFTAACRELSRRLTAMADAHTLEWWNLL